MNQDTAVESCDLLIEAGWVVPVVPHGVVLEDHAVAVSGDRIVAVSPIAEAHARFDAKETVSRPAPPCRRSAPRGAEIMRAR